MDALWKILPVCAVFLTACSHRPPLRTVEHVDLPRFMGDWYVISLLPWFAERGHVNTMDIYALREDGHIDITYAFRKGELTAPRKEWKAVAKVFDTKTNAHWKVQFIWPFAADYIVIYLSDDYQTTVIGHPSRQLAWIMSRKPQISDAEYMKAVRAMEGQGFPVDKLERVP